MFEASFHWRTELWEFLLRYKYIDIKVEMIGKSVICSSTHTQTSVKPVIKHTHTHTHKGEHPHGESVCVCVCLCVCGASWGMMGLTLTERCSAPWIHELHVWVCAAMTRFLPKTHDLIAAQLHFHCNKPLKAPWLSFVFLRLFFYDFISCQELHEDVRAS